MSTCRDRKTSPKRNPHLDFATYMLYNYTDDWMVSMTGKELLKLLERDGWSLDRISGSHHIMIKGSKTLSVPVHGNKALGKGLLNKLMKVGGLKK